jgi:invasion protein IalB
LGAALFTERGSSTHRRLLSHPAPIFGRFPDAAPNVTFPASPKLFVDGKDAASVDLTWMRCLPGGCFATADVSDDLLRKLKSSATPGRIEYRDAANRDVKLPFSFRGFGEAFDALGEEVVN